MATKRELEDPGAPSAKRQVVVGPNDTPVGIGPRSAPASNYVAELSKPSSSTSVAVSSEGRTTHLSIPRQPYAGDATAPIDKASVLSRLPSSGSVPSSSTAAPADAGPPRASVGGSLSRLPSSGALSRLPSSLFQAQASAPPFASPAVPIAAPTPIVNYQPAPNGGSGNPFAEPAEPVAPAPVNATTQERKNPFLTSSPGVVLANPFAVQNGHAPPIPFAAPAAAANPFAVQSGGPVPASASIFKAPQSITGISAGASSGASTGAPASAVKSVVPPPHKLTRSVASTDPFGPAPNPFAAVTAPAAAAAAAAAAPAFQVVVLPPPTPPKAPALVPLGSLPASAKKAKPANNGLLDWKHEYLHRGEWKPFRPHINQKLNICQRESKWSSARLTIDNEVFVFDFLRMAQVRVETGVQRAFRWTNPDTGLVVPSPVDFAHQDFTPLVLPPWQMPKGRELLEVLPEADPLYSELKGAFELADAHLDITNRVVCIHRVSLAANRGFWGHRQNLYKMTEEQVSAARGEPAQSVMAWHGTSSSAVVGILTSGFTIAPATNGRVLGHGVYFAPYTFPALSSMYCDADDSGLRHVLLCDVILGRVEKATAGMMAPSSPEFDNAVDDLRIPKRYIVWPTNMSTHVLPRYVLSFRQTAPQGPVRSGSPLTNSPVQTAAAAPTAGALMPPPTLVPAAGAAAAPPRATGP